MGDLDGIRITAFFDLIGLIVAEEGLGVGPTDADKLGRLPGSWPADADLLSECKADTALVAAMAEEGRLGGDVRNTSALISSEARASSNVRVLEANPNPGGDLVRLSSALSESSTDHLNSAAEHRFKSALTCTLNSSEGARVRVRAEEGRFGGDATIVRSNSGLSASAIQHLVHAANCDDFFVQCKVKKSERS